MGGGRKIRKTAWYDTALTFSKIPASQRYFMTEMTNFPLSGVGGRSLKN